MKSNISALILAKNEEQMIADCIKQLSFASEVIVLDQNSTDKTVKVAEGLGAKVYKSDSEDFAQNRNTLRSKANSDWLLYIDADERLDAKVISEIIEKIQEKDSASAYFFPRKNYMLGKWLKHGSWWPDYVPRLFKKNALLKWTGSVHESPTVEGPFAYVSSPITHLTARTVSKMLVKSIKWAKIESDLYAKANAPKVNALKILKSMFKEFIKRYFLKMGFFDYKIGLIQAIYQSLHAAIVLTYLWETQNKSEEKISNYKYE